MPIDRITTVVSGRLRIVQYAISRNDGEPPDDVELARTFIDELPPREKLKLIAIMQHVADGGEVGVPIWMFRHEPDGICVFKLKTAGQKRMVRIPCFRLGDRYLLTHGFYKPAKRKWPKGQLETATRIRTQHCEWEREHLGRDGGIESNQQRE